MNLNNNSIEIIEELDTYTKSRTNKQNITENSNLVDLNINNDYIKGKIDINTLLKINKFLDNNISVVKLRVDEILYEKVKTSNFLLDTIYMEDCINNIDFLIDSINGLLNYQIESTLGYTIFKDIKMLESKILLKAYKNKGLDGTIISKFYNENVKTKRLLEANKKNLKLYKDTFNVLVYKNYYLLDSSELLENYLSEVISFELTENIILGDFINFLNKYN